MRTRTEPRRGTRARPHERVAIGRLQSLTDGLTDRRSVRHAVVAVERGDGSLIFSGAAGTAHPDGTPMWADTPYHLASVTKLYTAATVLRLVEAGRVDLDAPLDRVLPRALVEGIHRLDGIDHSPALTSRHLLTHTSGLPDYFLETPEGDVSYGDLLVDGDFSYGIEDVTERIRRLSPHFPPQDPAAVRRRARYSDTNFQLLGAIVATSTGRTYEEAVEEQLLDRLELRHTWFAGRPRSTEAGVPATMWAGDTPLERPEAMRSMAPEGGLVATATDTIAFLRALVSGEAFERTDTFLRMQERFTRFGLPRDRTAIAAPAWPIEYGLGLKRVRTPRLLAPRTGPTTLLGHTGATGSWLFHCSEHDVYLAGTVDQTSAAAVPYRLASKLVRASRR